MLKLIGFIFTMVTVAACSGAIGALLAKYDEKYIG